MKAEMERHPSSFILHPLLSHLWLHEPDADAITHAVAELGLPPATTDELASAYADVFLLNVYPYGTAFTDPSGELNGPAAQQIAALYEAHGYQPPELNAVGAPDHVGLCLGFLGELGELEIRELSLDWIAVCCLAVERESAAPPFYRALANITREALFAHQAHHALPSAPITNSPILQFSDPQEELSLRDLLRFFLAPAHCGMFLSRSRLGQMAKELGLRLPFGSRFEVAEMLFASAGEAGQVEQLIAALEVEVETWETAYHSWAGQWPFADIWLARTTNARRTLAAMRQILATTSA
jgi:TorA maturation chaperone TorD